MKKKPVVAILLILVAVLLAGAVTWAVLTNKLVVVWNGSGTPGSLAVNVCDSTLVDEYNKVTEYTRPDGAEVPPSIDVEGLRKVVERIEASSGYESDPTCQVMLFWAAIADKDHATADGILPVIKDLHAKRIFPDNNLRTTVPLFEYDAALEYIAPTQQDEAAQ